MIFNNKLYLVCIQETKWELINQKLCETLRVLEKVYFSFSAAIERSGGLLVMWDMKCVYLLFSSIFSHAIWFKGV